MMATKFRSLRVAVSLAVLLAVPLVASADEVLDSINEGVEAYKEGAYKDAVESLNFATQLIQQMKGKGLEAHLPAPLPGWKAGEASSQAAGAAMFGGGISAQRDYTKDNSRVSINIVTDSPIMQGMMMMFSNPMFATSDGGQMKKIQRQKAIVKIDAANNSGEIQIIVAERALVSLTGEQVDEETLMAFANAIDFKNLEKDL